jgi:hypothetical protein
VEKDETTEVTEEVAETEEMDVGDEATTDERGRGRRHSHNSYCGRWRESL